jgi:hypothetical protein
MLQQTIGQVHDQTWKWEILGHIFLNRKRNEIGDEWQRSIVIS